MLDESARLVEWAIRCRRLWFESLESALDRALPGAGEALVSAAAAVDAETGVLRINVPPIHPVLPPVYDVVQHQVAQVLWETFGNPVAHTVSFKAPTTTRRWNAGGLSVYAPGDPAPELWPHLSADFRHAVLTSGDPSTDALLSGVGVAALSLEHVWLRFTTPDARRGLGRLPGAASGLNDRLAEWNGGVTALCFAAEA